MTEPIRVKKKRRYCCKCGGYVGNMTEALWRACECSCDNCKQDNEKRGGRG